MLCSSLKKEQMFHVEHLKKMEHAPVEILKKSGKRQNISAWSIEKNCGTAGGKREKRTNVPRGTL